MTDSTPVPLTPHGEILAPSATPASPLGGLPPDQRDSLSAWCNLYLVLEAGAASENTAQAKRRDLQLFLDYFQRVTGCDNADQWTRSVTSGFLKHLTSQRKYKPTTVNRVLATLKHAAKWVGHYRPFLAGDPTERIQELQPDDPEWLGLTDIEVTRLRSALEQLVKLNTGRHRMPLRDYAVFLTLLFTGLRVSELLSLDRHQYQGKHLVDVRRKGRRVSRKVFLPLEVREALDDYLGEEREGSEVGPLIVSRSGQRLARQHVDRALKRLADHANRHLLEVERITISPHVLRHTFLRKLTESRGIQHALEASGHSSSRYIWRYVKPGDAEREEAIEGLF